jgi:OOP family OmpA-OmpF porin
MIGSTDLRTLFVVLACLVTSHAAVAADPPHRFYIGAGAGGSFYDGGFGAQVRAAYAGTPFTIAAADLTDDSDTAFRVFGGWRFARYGAVELGYVDVGRARGHYTVVDVSLHPNFRDTRHDVSGAQLSLVGLLPVGDRATLHAKLGVLAARVKYAESGFDGRGDPHSFGASDTQARLAWGAGAAWRFTDRLSARADWDRYEGVGRRFALDASGNGRFDHVDMVTASLVFAF